MAKHWKISKDKIISSYREGKRILFSGAIKTAEGKYSIYGVIEDEAERKDFYSYLTERQYQELIEYGNSLKSRKEGS